MRPTIIDGKRGGKVLLFQGFRYYRNKTTSQNIHWRCWRSACQTTLTTTVFDLDAVNPRMTVLFRSAHNHIEDDEVIKRDRIVNNVKHEVRQNLSRPIRRVYDDVSRTHHQGGGDRELPQFNSVRSIMGRERRSHVPPTPASIQDVVIDGEWTKTWSGAQFLLHLDNDWGVAVFATEENLQRLQKCKDIYMDGTFRTCQAPYSQ